MRILATVLCVLATFAPQAIGATVASTPQGPPAPASGWAVPYADGFGAPLGTGAGQDGTFRPSTNNQGCCGNSDEIAVERPNQVSVTPNGLAISCEALTAPIEGKNYSCGGVRGVNESGWAGPVFNITGGATLVFEMKGTLPPNLGTADPGWWMNGPPWTNTEFDFPEFYGSGNKYTSGSGWSKTPDYFHWFVGTEPTKWGITAFKPNEGVHTYTVEVRPGATSGKYVMQTWMDGVLQKLPDETEGCYTETCAKTVSREVTPTFTEDHLILTYGLRKPGSGTNEFSFGSNSFTVRSVAVYEDNAHAGVGIKNAGIAPGTIIEGTVEEPPTTDPDKAQDEAAEAAGTKAIAAAETALREAKTALAAIKADS